jgi:hypothetical protein
MLKPLSKVAVGETEESLKIVQKRIEQSKYVDEAIAIAIMGDVPMNIKNRFRKRKILIELSHSTESQQKKNFEAVVSLLGGKDFFDTARLAMEIAGMMAKQEPSEETR